MLHGVGNLPVPNTSLAHAQACMPRNWQFDVYKALP
jgi:hypothetical protein